MNENIPPPDTPIKSERGNNGRGKLTPHRSFILSLHDQGASLSAIQADLLRDRSLEVTLHGLRYFLKAQTARRLAGKALVDFDTAKVLKEAVEMATELKKGGYAKTITPATTTATEPASARPDAPTTSEPALLAPVSQVVEVIKQPIEKHAMNKEPPKLFMKQKKYDLNEFTGDAQNEQNPLKNKKPSNL